MKPGDLVQLYFPQSFGFQDRIGLVIGPCDSPSPNYFKVLIDNRLMDVGLGYMERLEGIPDETR